MEKAHLLPPTFESDHGKNQFTTRLLLHHFLNEEDIKWLSSFNKYGLNENQKRALIFVNETGAIDNSVHRQLNGVDVLKASSDLRMLREKEILEQKGKSRSTYYIPGLAFHGQQSDTIEELSAPPLSPSAPPLSPSAPPLGLSAPPLGLSVPVETNLSTLPPDLSTLPPDLSTPPDEISTPVDRDLINTVPSGLRAKIEFLPDRINDANVLKTLILQLCEWRALKSTELSGLLGKSEKYR